MVRSRWYLIAGLVALGMAASLTTARFLEQRQRQDENARRVACPIRPVVLRLGDGPSFLPARDAPTAAGVEMQVARHRGSWIQVELADGTTGWLPLDAVVINDVHVRLWFAPKAGD
jgi:hypothetical protein